MGRKRCKSWSPSLRSWHSCSWGDKTNKKTYVQSHTTLVRMNLRNDLSQSAGFRNVNKNQELPLTKHLLWAGSCFYRYWTEHTVGAQWMSAAQSPRIITTIQGGMEPQLGAKSLVGDLQAGDSATRNPHLDPWRSLVGRDLDSAPLS